MQNTAKQYKLKPEHIQVFTNLSKGESLWQIDAFLNLDKPVSKIYRDAEQADYHYKILQKLVEAGFLDEIDTGISYIEK